MALQMLQQIFQVCIIPLLGILTTYLILFINKKSKELQAQTDNELYKKYISMLEQTVINCVIATNQTYVNALKEQNAFDAEAQKEAFKRTYEQVMAILSDDAKNYLNEAIGDLQTYIINQIEAQVNLTYRYMRLQPNHLFLLYINLNLNYQQPKKYMAIMDVLKYLIYKLAYHYIREMTIHRPLLIEKMRPLFYNGKTRM